MPERCPEPILQPERRWSFFQKMPLRVFVELEYWKMMEDVGID